MKIIGLIAAFVVLNGTALGTCSLQDIQSFESYRAEFYAQGAVPARIHRKFELMKLDLDACAERISAEDYCSLARPLMDNHLNDSKQLSFEDYEQAMDRFVAFKKSCG